MNRKKASIEDQVRSPEVKQRILKAVGEKQEIIYKGIPITITVGLSAHT